VKRINKHLNALNLLGKVRCNDPAVPAQFETPTVTSREVDSFRDNFERYISKERDNAHLRRKAYTAIAAQMVSTIHAVVNHGEPYRPLFERRLINKISALQVAQTGLSVV